MTTNIDRAAGVIADALRPALSTADGIGHDLARALADAGLLTPDLQELSESSEAGVTAFGQVYVRYGVDDLHMTPAEARALALALIAAADHAEEVDRADA